MAGNTKLDKAVFSVNEADFKKYLEDRYNPQMNWYSKNASHNKRIYQGLQTLVIVFSVITPTIIAIGEGWLRWLALTASAIVAVGVALLKAFKYHEHWTNYRTTRETLRKEIHYYRARLFGYKEAEDPEALFVERVEAVISRENTLWIYVQKREETKNGKMA